MADTSVTGERIAGQVEHDAITSVIDGCRRGELDLPIFESDMFPLIFTKGRPTPDDITAKHAINDGDWMIRPVIAKCYLDAARSAWRPESLDVVIQAAQEEFAALEAVGIPVVDYYYGWIDHQENIDTLLPYTDIPGALSLADGYHLAALVQLNNPPLPATGTAELISNDEWNISNLLLSYLKAPSNSGYKLWDAFRSDQYTGLGPTVKLVDIEPRIYQVTDYL